MPLCQVRGVNRISDFKPKMSEHMSQGLEQNANFMTPNCRHFSKVMNLAPPGGHKLLTF